MQFKIWQFNGFFILIHFQSKYKIEITDRLYFIALRSIN